MNPTVLELPLGISDPPRTDTSSRRPVVEVAGRRLEPTEVFDTYWRFAAARQRAYFSRLSGGRGPWSDDPVIVRHRFTNPYRASDRVSQFLIRSVIYRGSQEPNEVIFRILLFKFFNRISTWETLVNEIGEPAWMTYSFAAYDASLTALQSQGKRVYSGAYVIPPPRVGETTKHRNHLRLLETMMRDRVADRAAACGSLREVFELLKSYPSVGSFLAYQFVIDINYSEVVSFDEMDFVAAGPGARDGIRKCFGTAADGIEAQLIRWMADNQAQEFDRLGLTFQTLWGRPLQLIDVQNLFCEVDKYARVVHPKASGISGRVRIKQIYRPDPAALSPWFPPKWGLNAKLASATCHGSRTGTAGAGRNVIAPRSQSHSTTPPPASTSCLQTL